MTEDFRSENKIVPGDYVVFSTPDNTMTISGIVIGAVVQPKSSLINPLGEHIETDITEDDVVGYAVITAPPVVAPDGSHYCPQIPKEAVFAAYRLPDAEAMALRYNNTDHRRVKVKLQRLPIWRVKETAEEMN